MSPPPTGRLLRRGVLVLVACALAILGSPAVTASAQTAASTTWVARTTDTEWVFDTPMPEPFVAVATCDPAKYARAAAYCQRSSQTVGGQTYQLLRTTLAWDKDLIDTGMVTYANNDGAGALWLTLDTKAAGWGDGLAKLKSLVTRTKGTWKYVDLYLAVGQPSPTVRLPIPELTQIKTRMTKLATTTTPGTFYPNVTVPTDLAAFRTQMLNYGNIGRRDPDFRKTNGSQTVTDLSQNTVITKNGKNGPEKVYREFTKPPYFTDHKPNADLDRMAQFQAEYTASRGYSGHDGPSSYRDPATGRTVKMSDMTDRANFFGVANVVEAGSGPGDPDDVPQGWMAGETHFRPWFNVDGTYPEIGYGVARSADGRWFAIAVPKIAKDAVVPLDRLALPLDSTIGTKETAGQSTITTDVTPKPDTLTTGPTRSPDAGTVPPTGAPAAVATQQAAPAAAGVTLCANDSFGAPCSTLSADSPNLSSTEVGNDTLSSIRVPAGTWVSLYRDFDFGGTCRAFSGDQPSLTNLPPGDNQVSSMKIGTTPPSGCATQDVLTLCPDDNFLGTCITPTADTPDVTGTALDNDKLSSVLVPAGTYLAVYQDFDYKGACQSFSGNRAVLAGTRIGTDQASSFKITKSAPAGCAEN